MTKSNPRRWWFLLCFAIGSAFLAWTRTQNPYLSLFVGALVLFISGSLFAGHNAVSAYAQVVSKHADAANAPQQTDAYQVRRLLTRFRYEPAVEGLADLALTQLKQIEGHYKHFEKTLNEKLHEGELTYERYHNAGVHAFEGVLENLRRGASLIEQLSRARDSELVGKLETIFAKNDEALHGFEKINAALEHLSGGDAPQRLQDAIQDLEDLSKQAHKYSAQYAANRE